MNTADVARPFESEVAVAVLFTAFANVPLAPDVGAVNVTETPLAGLPFEVTNATRGDAKGPMIP